MHFLAYILVYPILWLVSILPFPLLYGISDVMYVLVYRVFGYRTKTVKSNLKLAFPNKSDQEISDITTKFYHHLCDMIMESIKSMTISEKELKKRFTFTNIEEIHKVEQEGKSIALMCSHYASWEWIFILQRYMNHDGYAVYKRLNNTYFDKLVKRIRAKYNTYLYSNKEIVPILFKAKRNHQVCTAGFVADQSPKAEKALYWQNFMGIKVPVHVGAEVLAKRLDMPVMFYGVKKVKRGHYQTTFSTITLDPKSFKDFEITDAYIKLCEAQILDAPEYYLWTHKRWKHRDKVPAKFL